MTERAPITVDVVCAWPHRTWRRRVSLPSGSTVGCALAAAGSADAAALIGETVAIGVFGKVVALDHPLNDGDRVELYRPLLADPKDARRTRAASNAA